MIDWYMLLAAVLFVIGAIGLLVRRNALVMFMCVELMLNAVNLTLITAGSARGDINGQMATSSCWWWRRPRWWWVWRSSSRSSAPGRRLPSTTCRS